MSSGEIAPAEDRKEQRAITNTMSRLTPVRVMTELWIQPIISIVFLVVCGMAGDILIYGRRAARDSRRARY